MARTNKLIFEDAIKARDSITSSQRKDIAKLYEQWAKEIGKTAEKFGKKTNSSAPLSEAYMNQLKKQLETTGRNVASNVEKKIKDNMLVIADNVIADNAKWLKNMGFSKGKIDAAFSYVPNDVVERLVTGKVYQSGWSLSKAIWGDSKDTLSKVYEIIAGGFAKQQSIYEIAKDLESFVSPSAKKMWNLTDKDGRKIYPKMVDYSAQRLARTLAQHTYQQAFQEATKDNPFVLKYKWVSNGSRVCDICKKRDGKLFDKDKLPMDHPNGMCVIEPVTMNKEERLDKLADWVKGKDGDYPEIDAFAKKLGFDSKSVQTGSKGTSKAKPKTTTAKTKTASKKAAPKVLKNEVVAPAVNDAAERDVVVKSIPRKLKNHIKLDAANNERFIDDLMYASAKDRNAFLHASGKVRWQAAEGTACYRYRNHSVNVNISDVIDIAEDTGRSNKFSTLYHEIGHAIDATAKPGSRKVQQSTTKSSAFYKAVIQDLKDIASSLDGKGPYERKKILGIMSNVNAGMVQDAMSGAAVFKAKWAKPIADARKRYFLKWAHSDSYWLRRNAMREVASETFANLFASRFNSVEREFAEKYFPRAFAEVDNIVDTYLERYS